MSVRVSGKRILGTLLHLGARLGRTGRAQEFAGDEPPLRSELFSSDQMKRHGKDAGGLAQAEFGTRFGPTSDASG